MEEVPYTLIEEEPSGDFCYVLFGLFICLAGFAVFILSV